jgi:hypothetical protein
MRAGFENFLSPMLALKKKTLVRLNILRLLQITLNVHSCEIGQTVFI